MPTEARILPAIRYLYDAATDASKWAGFLKELAHCFGADGANLIRVNPEEQALTFCALHGYDSVVRRLFAKDGADLGTALARYERRFAELMPTDPRVRFIERFPSRPLSCRLEIAEAEIHGSRMYRDILKHADVEYSLVVSVPEDDGSLIMFGVFRGRASTHFTEPEVELFGEIIPHVKQAVGLSERLARVDFANRVALEALDALSVGVLIVDGDGRVMHANAAGRRIAAMADGVTLHGGSLKLHRRDEDAALGRAIWEAVAQAASGESPPGQALTVSRPSGNEPFPVMVSGLWGNHLRYGLGRLDEPLAVVFVTVPEEPQEVPAELLRRLFGLTPAEARLCERLVLGRTVEEAAHELAIATGTARIQLKSVFAKTGVGRQTELVAKILSTPVWVRHRGTTVP